jgi:hypothetical protein
MSAGATCGWRRNDAARYGGRVRSRMSAISDEETVFRLDGGPPRRLPIVACWWAARAAKTAAFAGLPEG